MKGQGERAGDAYLVGVAYENPEAETKGEEEVERKEEEEAETKEEEEAEMT